jgi:hypothetical protein
MAGVAAFSSPSTAAPQAVSVWQMDETSGTTMIDSLGANNGTQSNVTLGVPGLVGTAYGFNGVNSVVVVPDSPSLNPGSSDFSFTLSVRFSIIPDTDYDLLRKGLSTTKGGDYKLEALSRQHGSIAQANCLFTGSSGTSHLVAGPDLSNGQWHTITCAKSTTTISLTIDGQTYSKAASVGSITNSAPLTLGAKLKGTKLRDRYVDAMDEVTFSIGS